MADVREKVEQIRQAVYGKEVRESIASGIEAINTDIDALNDLVDALDSRVDTIITTPISGGAAAQEIVDARASAVKSKTFATLDARFEETEQDVESHMAENAKHTSGFINVKEFGVHSITEPGFEMFDSTTALQNAINYATDNDLKLEGAPGNYLVTGTINITCHSDLTTMNIYGDGTLFSPVVRAGYSLNDQVMSRKIIDLPAVFNYKNGAVVSNWTGTGVGVELSNSSQCKFNVPYVYGFETGIQCAGYSEGFAYNQVELQITSCCKVSLKLTKFETGWCNDNLFINGRLTPRSASGGKTVDDYIGTRAIAIINGSNNVFMKPCIEGVYTEYGMEFQTGSYNQIYGARYEGDGAKKIYFNPPTDNACDEMLFMGGYQAARVNFYYNSYKSIGHVRVASTGNSFETIDVNRNGLKCYPAGYALGNEDPTKWVSKIDQFGIYTKLKDDSEESATTLTTAGYLKFGIGGYIRKYGAGMRMKGSITPSVDNVDGLGSASNRYTQIFAQNGAINTSDEREKDCIEAIPDTWLDAWSDVQWTRFKIKDAIAKKGIDSARWHTGLIAQRVKTAFENHGIDAFEIGLLCYDEWDSEPETSNEDEVCESGDRYGIRYNEALSMECAYQRRELERLKAKLLI